MPSTGTPSSKRPRSSRGAPGAYTDAGPPDRMIPRGLRLAISSSDTLWGSISEKTPQSRTRLAISWLYCPPKSSTTISSTAPVASVRCSAAGAGTVAAASVIGEGGRLAVGGAHADALVALQRLALGLKRRRDHDLGAVELGEVLVSARGHRRAQPAEQVERAVVLPRRADQDLLERAVLGRCHPRSARERRVKGRHAPMEAPSRSLVGPCQRRADHHGIGAQRDRLRDVAPVAHATVGDHLAVLAGLQHMRG